MPSNFFSYPELKLRAEVSYIDTETIDSETLESFFFLAHERNLIKAEKVAQILNLCMESITHPSSVLHQ